SPSDKTSIYKFQVSPDGRMIAYNATGPDGRGGLWVRPLDSVETRKVADTDPDIPLFFWSFDSRFLAYGAVNNKLAKVDVGGGPPELLCDAPSGFVVGGAWNRDGILIFGSYPGGISRVPSTGGNVTPVTVMDPARQETGHFAP